ncbi:MAG: hypothetical protein JWM82_3352 [Myxococcales bacterium]|nr:hypothetical protein [Myxococcales bacterium]
MTSPFLIRPGVDSDLAFVKDSWRSTFCLGGFGCSIPEPLSTAGNRKRQTVLPEKTHYHNEMTRVFDRILKRATVRVACDSKDPDSLVGFAVYTGTELHFVYVRLALRESGVAKALLEGLPIRTFTFLTQSGNEYLKPTARGWQFTPRWTIH